MAATLGVLVAGGAGARLGLGVPKAALRLGDLTLLERALGTLAAVCDAVVVTAPARLALPLPAAVPAAGGVLAPRRVADPDGRAGPLAGMVAGLEAGAFTRALVLGVDLPFLGPPALAGLLGRLGRHQAVVPAPGGFLQPLAAAYAPSAAAVLSSRLAAGERSPTRALGSLDALVLDDAALERLPGGPGGFFNLNTREDLAEAERRLAAREAAR